MSRFGSLFYFLGFGDHPLSDHPPRRGYRDARFQRQSNLIDGINGDVWTGWVVSKCVKKYIYILYFIRKRLA